MLGLQFQDNFSGCLVNWMSDWGAFAVGAMHVRVHAYFLKVCMRLQQLSRNACTRTKELVRRNFFKKSFYFFGSFRVCTVRVGCFRVGLRDFFFGFRGFGVGCFFGSLELETCGCVFDRLAEGAV